MSDIKRCWAYSQSGSRCDHPAGHPGNHVILTEWTDEECAVPGGAKVIRQEPQEPTPAEPPTTPIVKAAICTACQHGHRGGVCKCGCYEFIG